MGEGVLVGVDGRDATSPGETMISVCSERKTVQGEGEEAQSKTVSSEKAFSSLCQKNLYLQ